MLQVGWQLWPGWLLHNRGLVMGIGIVAVIFIAMFAPLMVEVSVDPRPLSGPGDLG
jgi:hypothetical protein